MPEIFEYIKLNLTKFAQLNLSSSMIFYGGRGVGKTTFMFQTSFFNMLADQLAGVNGAGEGVRGLRAAWVQAYEIGIDQRTRVEKKTNLLPFEDNSS